MQWPMHSASNQTPQKREIFNVFCLLGMTTKRGRYGI
ncbi:hypothetical protein MAR_034781 [Mya arenaria]|uniref:Uncharacterized protein n=1 Tax=Mya arenaria TaxID=6604 RepID=A0ABY7EIJ3_MYAAR|nr:hypothetical protein MAR_034781 [Mya arenaria]